jgi:hypothetical protein
MDIIRIDDTADDPCWLTHAELAAARGISTASAIKLALRHRWQKQRDSHGTLRCLVPADFIGPAPDPRADARADTRADLSAAITTLQATVTLLSDQLHHERARADTAEAERDDLRDKLAAAQVECAVAQGQAEAATARAVAAVEAKRKLRDAEVERRTRGRWARLRGAWQGV